MEIGPGALGLSKVQTFRNLLDRKGRLLPQTRCERQFDPIALRGSRQFLFGPL
jgi:hypothetical protein